jgi:hypothetical protein
MINYHPSLKDIDIINIIGQYHGSFHLTIEAAKSTEETEQLPRYTFDGPSRYLRHDSIPVGRLTKLNADHIYSTWKMKRITKFFPSYERQHWNTQYQAARTIFTASPISLASQGTIKFAHRELFKRTLKHNDTS